MEHSVNFYVDCIRCLWGKTNDEMAFKSGIVKKGTELIHFLPNLIELFDAFMPPLWSREPLVMSIVSFWCISVFL